MRLAIIWALYAALVRWIGRRYQNEEFVHSETEREKKKPQETLLYVHPFVSGFLAALRGMTRFPDGHSGLMNMPIRLMACSLAYNSVWSRSNFCSCFYAAFQDDRSHRDREDFPFLRICRFVIRRHPIRVIWRDLDARASNMK